MIVYDLTKKISDNILNFFRQVDVTVTSDPESDFDYILIDNLAGIEEANQFFSNKQLISINENINASKFIDKSGVLILSESVLLSSFGQMFYERFFLQSPSLHLPEDLRESYTDHFKYQVNSLSVTGSYFDDIFDYFSVRGFDSVSSRIFLNTLILFISGLNKCISMPMSISGMSNEKSIVMSFELDVIDDLEFKLEKTKITLQEILLKMMDYSNFCEISYIEESKKILICTEWDLNTSMLSIFSFMNVRDIVNNIKDINFKPSFDDYVLQQMKEIEDSEEAVFAKDSEKAESIKVNQNLDEVKEEVISKIKEESEEDPFEVEEIPDSYLEDEIRKIDGEIEKKESSTVPPSKKEDDFLTKISAEKEKKKFSQKMTSSFEDGFKNELMRVKSTGEKSISVDRLMNSVLESAKNKGAITSNSDDVLKSMSSEEVMEKILDLIRAESSSRDDEEIKKLKAHEKMLKEKSYKLEREVKVLSREIQKTERMFESEMMKMNRSIEARDQVVKKTKGVLEKVTIHKDKEIAELRRRLGEATSSTDKAKKGIAADERIEKHLQRKIENEKKVSRKLITDLSKKKAEMKKAMGIIDNLKATVKKQEGALRAAGHEKKANRSGSGMSLNEKRLDMALKKAKLEVEKLKKDTNRIRKENMQLKNEKNTLINTRKRN